ncbi:cupin domain-containing protein [Geodermatophilus sp. SYSU D00703]
MRPTATTPDSAVDLSAVQGLLAGGRLRIEQLMDAELHQGQVLNVPRVELAPGVVEPAHVHPGAGGVFGVAGRGFVEMDHTDRVPLAPGAFVHVEQGTVKALGNNGSGPLVVLAVLVLDGDQPPLTVAQ